MTSSIPPYAQGPGPSNHFQHPPSSPRFNNYNQTGQPGPSNAYSYQHMPRGSPGRPNSRGGMPFNSRSGGSQFPSAPNSAIYSSQTSPQNYPPQYMYPGGTHGQSWQPEQPMSPLPTQLSIFPPPELRHVHSPPPIEQPISPQNFSQSQPVEIVPEEPAPSADYDVFENEGSETGHQGPEQTWVIWSRRPADPSLAPGIIFSPRCKPPPHVLARAMEVPSPPPLPKPFTFVQNSTEQLRNFDRPLEDDESRAKWQPNFNQRPLPLPPQEDSITSVSPDKFNKDTSALPKSDTNSTVPSSSTTETTETPTLGSPMSSSTSISLSVMPSKEPTTIAENLVSAAQAVELTTTETLTPTFPVPTTTSPTVPVKKSWASLLQPASSSASGTSGSKHSKNLLPTSSVVGFSVPAVSSLGTSESDDAQLPGSGFHISSQKKAELISLLTSPPTSFIPGSLLKIRSRGLINTGNMCFANSVLQILLYCPPYYKLFTELGKILPKKSVNNEDTEASSSTPLMDATMKFISEFIEEPVGEEGKSRKMTLKDAKVKRGRGKERDVQIIEPKEDDWDADSFIPTYVYDALKEKKRFDHMRGGQQEDAEEFFGFFLDSLEEELLAIVNVLHPTPSITKSAVEEREEEESVDDGWMEVGKRNRTVVTRTVKTTESPITRLFGGKFRSALRAPHQKDSVIVEDWRALRLDIQSDHIHTIEDAFAHISDPESIQMSHPLKPGVVIEASQQVLIEALPPVLVLHLKRFCYDVGVGGVVKVGKQVRFGMELNIRPDILAPAVKKQYQSARYRLFGAVYHHGLSASGGHYTLDVLHPNRYPGAKLPEGWIRIDDELVSDVRSEDVFDSFEKDDTRNAYLLFYLRIR